MAQASTATPSSQQVAGDHYAASAVQCPHCHKWLQHWDIYAKLPHLIAAITKYLWRYKFKGKLEDLKKALSYLMKLIEMEELDIQRVTPQDRAKMPIRIPVWEGGNRFGQVVIEPGTKLHKQLVAKMEAADKSAG